MPIFSHHEDGVFTVHCSSTAANVFLYSKSVNAAFAFDILSLLLCVSVKYVLIVKNLLKYIET